MEYIKPEWENKGTKATMAMADEFLEIIRGFDPALELKYNKYYVGLVKQGWPNNGRERHPPEPYSSPRRTIFGSRCASSVRKSWNNGWMKPAWMSWSMSGDRADTGFASPSLTSKSIKNCSPNCSGWPMRKAENSAR